MINKTFVNSINKNLVFPAARQQLIYSFLTVHSSNPKSDAAFQAAGKVVLCYENELMPAKDVAARITDRCYSMIYEQFASNVVIAVGFLCRTLPDEEAAALKTATYFEEYLQDSVDCLAAVAEAQEALYGYSEEYSDEW